MQLTTVYPGTVTSLGTIVHDNHGTRVQAPLPLYVLGNGVAAAPKATLTDSGELVFDLNLWQLHDMQVGRNTGISVTGSPTTAEAARVAAQYAREARGLDEYDLASWVQAHFVTAP